MGNFKLTLFAFLNRYPYLRKYSRKIISIVILSFVVIFLSTTLVLILQKNYQLPLHYMISVMAVISIAVLTGAIIILKSLFEPFNQITKSLDKYLKEREMPDLPTHYRGELGILMKEVQYSIMSFDSMINEREDIVSLLGHDIRNLINVVQTYAELIPLNYNKQDYLNNLHSLIITAVEAQNKLITDVFELLENERTIIKEENLEEINLVETFDDILTNFEFRLEQKKISVNLNLEVINVNAHRILLKQALFNIFSNAVKFTKNGSIKIESYSKDDKCYILIQDTGIGFSPENSDKLFERFTKYKRRGTDGEHTTGLGLYLTKKIIERHGGTVNAYSDGEGKGAEFKIMCRNKMLI